MTILLSRVDGRAESVGESRLRIDLALAGIPVVPQMVVLDENGRFGARADFGIEGSLVLIEFDGLVKYRKGGVEALIAEKHREDRLRRLGYIVVRVTWSDLDHPRVLISRVRQAMAAAAGLVPAA